MKIILARSFGSIWNACGPTKYLKGNGFVQNAGKKTMQKENVRSDLTKWSTSSNDLLAVADNLFEFVSPFCRVSY